MRRPSTPSIRSMVESSMESSMESWLLRASPVFVCVSQRIARTRESKASKSNNDTLSSLPLMPAGATTCAATTGGRITDAMIGWMCDQPAIPSALQPQARSVRSSTYKRALGGLIALRIMAWMLRAWSRLGRVAASGP